MRHSRGGGLADPVESGSGRPRLAVHARRRWLRIERTWPWAHVFVLAWKRLTQLPATT